MDNWIFKYHEAIQKKEVIVGVWVRLCFEILTTGLLNGEWEFNEKKANKAIKFIENFCHHSEGRSDLLHLELWQKAIVSAIFGIMDKTTGYRQFREVFIIVARKNGKTLFAAAIAAYMTYVDGEYGAKVYFLAPKLDQADLVYDAFYQIVQSDDELDSITKKRRSDIYIKAFNTSVKKIAFNSKKSDGFNPQLVVNDEMEAWPGDQGLKQYEVMTSALGARKQPLIISIATAGYVNDGIFDELFKRATAFLKGNSREKRLLPFIYMIDDIEKWDSIEELKKSNPNLGVSVSAEYYLEQIEIARNSISKKVEFMTKFCNIKQNSAVAWLDYWDVMKCVHEEKPLSLEDFKGCYCVGGIDLSRTTDLTAASIVINRDGINHIFTRFYMPQKRYEVAINEDNTPYNIYRDRGFLFISGENQVDYKDVYNWFIELVKVYKIKPLKIGYDRYSANYLVEDLKTAGFHTDDVYQGTNLTPILHEFEGNLKDGLFDFGDNSMLAAHFLNVAVDINLNDSRMKPVKIEKRMRIDGAMSVFDALTMVSKYHNEIGKKLLNIYRYYGVNDKILTSTLNDTEFISFYENVIEPISVQLSYEFTFKLLTPREIGYGNRIDFVANLLQYATLQTRETIGGGMFDRGALTINEYRELMYYGPVEDGDQRLVSLNYVKVGDQSLYQVGQQNEPPDDTGANDREKRAMQAAARAYMQIMKGG